MHFTRFDFLKTYQKGKKKKTPWYLSDVLSTVLPLRDSLSPLSRFGAAGPTQNLSYRMKCLFECYFKLRVNFCIQPISRHLLVFYCLRYSKTTNRTIF